MPFFRSIHEDIAKCMCCNSKEASSPPYFRRRENIEMPARPVQLPAQQVKPLRSPDPRWIQGQQAQGGNVNPGDNGASTVVLVPKRQRSSPSHLDLPPLEESGQVEAADGRPKSRDGSLSDELPPTPTPKAKQRPIVPQIMTQQPQAQAPHRVNSQMSKSDDPRIVRPASQGAPEGPDRIDA